MLLSHLGLLRKLPWVWQPASALETDCGPNGLLNFPKHARRSGPTMKVYARCPPAWPRTSPIILETMAKPALPGQNQAIPLVLTSQQFLLQPYPSASKQIGATLRGVTLTHATAMPLTLQKATTTLVRSSTARQHAAPRTHTLHWRAQPTLLGMLNVQLLTNKLAMPFLSRWALA